jgi:hypothetical protein
MKITEAVKVKRSSREKEELLTPEDERPNPVLELDVGVPASEYDVCCLDLQSIE